MYLLNLSFTLVALTGLTLATPQHYRHARGQCSHKSQSTISWTSAGTSSRCYTDMGSTTVPWASSTTWSTHYTPCVSTSTTTSTVVTAPPAVTTTVTTTSTTTTTEPTTSFTSTVATTTTISTSSTTTTTTVTTATTTSTTSSTSTVPTSTGFLPIQTSDPGTTYDGTSGGSPVAKRDIPNAFVGFSQNNYPQGVSCYQFQPSASCSVSIVTSTTTIQGNITQTVTTTSTTTSTSTIVPSATVTTTSTTSSTTTSIITATATSTTTITATTTSATTVYAACATNNFADYYKGDGIGGGGTSSTSNVPVVAEVTADDAYDCCVAALTSPKYAQIWAFRLASSTNNCIIENSAAASDCAAGQSSNSWTVEYQSGQSPGCVLGNANCGSWTANSG